MEKMTKEQDAKVDKLTADDKEVEKDLKVDEKGLKELKKLADELKEESD
jgi:hypothetical protein